MAASPPDITSPSRGERTDKAGSSFMKKAKALQKTSEGLCSSFSLSAPCHKAWPRAACATVYVVAPESSSYRKGASSGLQWAETVVSHLHRKHLKTHTPRITTRKTSEKSKMEGHSIKCLTNTSQNGQGHPEQEEFEKLSQPLEA